MKPTNITKCRECGGTSLTWDTVNRARNGIQQNRLNTRDVECVFFLGCDNCSETLATVSADRIAAMLNSNAVPVKCDGNHGGGQCRDPECWNGGEPRGQVDIEAAAKRLASCMDYPWEHMPEQGRKAMREHAQSVISAATEGKP